MEQSKTNQFNVLAEKPVGSLLMQYAIPAIVAMAASSVYNIIDGIFIGQAWGQRLSWDWPLPVRSCRSQLLLAPWWAWVLPH